MALHLSKLGIAGLGWHLYPPCPLELPTPVKERMTLLKIGPEVHLLRARGSLGGPGGGLGPGERVLVARVCLLRGTGSGVAL